MGKSASIRFICITELCLLILNLLVLGALLWIFVPYTIFWYAMLFLQGAVYLFFSCFYIPMYTCNLQLELTPEAIVMTTGVFFLRKRYQIASQISSAVSCRYPPACFFGMCTLILYAPGSMLIIPLLDNKKADEIAGRIQKTHR